MMQVLLLRRWFVYACAFAGAGYFADAAYRIISSPIPVPNDIWIIIGVAVGLAVVLTLVPALSSQDE
jgi:hypothetical protein